MYSKNPKAPAFHRLADYQGINMLDGFNISCIWFMLMAHFLVTWAINFHPGKCCVKVDLGPDMFNFVDKPQWYYKKGPGGLMLGTREEKHKLLVTCFIESIQDQTRTDSEITDEEVTLFPTQLFTTGEEPLLCILELLCIFAWVGLTVGQELGIAFHVTDYKVTCKRNFFQVQ